MKISIKWLLVLTLIISCHLSLNLDVVVALIGALGFLMALLWPVVAFSRWSIGEEDGWWKFQGSSTARIVVWIYALSMFNIFLAVIRLAFEPPKF